MNVNERARRRLPPCGSLLRGLAVTAAAMAWAAHAQHDVPAGTPAQALSTPEWPDTDIVDELLRRETRAALLAQARRRGMAWAMAPGSASRADPDAPAEPQPDRLDLAAIYGVGKRLDVEVVVNGRRLRYRHGRKWPEESPDGEGAYALRAIQGHCVLLDRDGGNRRVCLSRAD
jgi:hypothetical protein